jgi:ABC-type dipeptide/oligopeptide/nickel transport system ATPase component
LLHPYTQALLRSIPRLRKTPAEEKLKRLQAIFGSIPHPARAAARLCLCRAFYTQVQDPAAAKLPL